MPWYTRRGAVGSSGRAKIELSSRTVRLHDPREDSLETTDLFSVAPSAMWTPALNRLASQGSQDPARPHIRVTDSEPARFVILKEFFAMSRSRSEDIPLKALRLLAWSKLLKPQWFERDYRERTDEYLPVVESLLASPRAIEVFCPTLLMPAMLLWPCHSFLRTEQRREFEDWTRLQVVPDDVALGVACLRLMDQPVETQLEDQLEAARVVIEQRLSVFRSRSEVIYNRDFRAAMMLRLASAPPSRPVAVTSELVDDCKNRLDALKGVDAYGFFALAAALYVATWPAVRVSSRGVEFAPATALNESRNVPPMPVWPRF